MTATGQLIIITSFIVQKKNEKRREKRRNDVPHSTSPLDFMINEFVHSGDDAASSCVSIVYRNHFVTAGPTISIFVRKRRMPRRTVYDVAALSLPVNTMNRILFLASERAAVKMIRRSGERVLINQHQKITMGRIKSTMVSRTGRHHIFLRCGFAQYVAC